MLPCPLGAVASLLVLEDLNRLEVAAATCHCHMSPCYCTVLLASAQPSNILLTPGTSPNSPILKLADFGLASGPGLSTVRPDTCMDSPVYACQGLLVECDAGVTLADHAKCSQTARGLFLFFLLQRMHGMQNRQTCVYCLQCMLGRVLPVLQWYNNAENSSAHSVVWKERFIVNCGSTCSL